MKYNNIIIAIACLLLLTSVFCSCKTNYKSDITAKTLADEMSAKFPVDGGYYTADSDILTVSFSGADFAKDFVVLHPNTSTNMNEMGIFRLSDEAEATSMKAIVDAYITSRKAAWMPNYLPDEKPKIDNARSAVFGNYVVYCIMTESDGNKFISEFESLIK